MVNYLMGAQYFTSSHDSIQQGGSEGVGGRDKYIAEPPPPPPPPPPPAVYKSQLSSISSESAPKLPTL